MSDTESWEGRVAEWKASGLSATTYCEGKPFTAGGLRHMAYRLRQAREVKAEVPEVRLARVVRKAARAQPPRAQPAVRERAGGEPLLVECGAFRVTVRPGFDRATLAALLDVLAARGGSR
jgi:hypothetical protein